MYNLFIGANNRTGKVEKAKIRAVVAKAARGFTLIDAIGYWEGKPEKSIIVQIEELNRAQVVELAQALKIELDQQAIGLQHLPNLSFI